MAEKCRRLGKHLRVNRRQWEATFPVTAPDSFHNDNDSPRSRLLITGGERVHLSAIRRDKLQYADQQLKKRDDKACNTEDQGYCDLLLIGDHRNYCGLGRTGVI